MDLVLYFLFKESDLDVVLLVELLILVLEDLLRVLVIVVAGWEGIAAFLLRLLVTLPVVIVDTIIEIDSKQMKAREG